MKKLLHFRVSPVLNAILLLLRSTDTANICKMKPEMKIDFNIFPFEKFFIREPSFLLNCLHCVTIMLFGFQLTSKAVFARQLALTATRENYVAKSSEFLSFPVEILSTKSNVNWLTFIQQRGFSTTPSPIAQRAQMPDNTETPVVYNVEFEVFGLVQGVFFRKYTQRHAQELGLTGWVQNTPRDTVIGQLQGSKEAVEKMKEWLSRTGSPHSKIDKCEFRGEGPVSKKSFTTFDVRH